MHEAFIFAFDCESKKKKGNPPKIRKSSVEKKENK